MSPPRIKHLVPSVSQGETRPGSLVQWVGETEAALRAVFERAQKFAPAVVLFDEIDSIAPSRSAESAQYQVSTVAQLLVLRGGAP
jgi:SpoVK/Ycf46/Vps4 family AAA+-type ATPase